MERIRLDECIMIDVLRRGLGRLYRNLVEAVDRTPPHVSSRSLIESSLGLAMGLVNTVELLHERCVSG